MKKPALVLIPALIALLVGGCQSRGGDSQSETTNTSSAQPTSSTTSETPTKPEPADQHVTGISISPTKAFVTQVNNVRVFKVSHEGSPTDQTEKAVTWSVSNPSIAKLELIEGGSEYYKNAQVTFLAVGNVTVTVTSQYNSAFTKSVTARVVESNDYTYLWNCTDKDKGKFTKVEPSDTQPPLEEPVVTEDDVELNGLSWHVKRYAANKDVSGSQYLRFGYGDKVGEGQIDFTLANTKEVESIEVGVSSKAKVIGKDDKGYDITEDIGSSKLTIKVGETTYLDKGDTAKGDNPEATSTPALKSYDNGDILLSFSPSVGYIYIQYIFIKFTHNVQSLNLDIDNCKTKFEIGDEFDYRGLKAIAKYSNDEESYDVSSLVEVIEPDLLTLGEKTVNVKYIESNITVTSSYKITVIEPRTIESVTISGEPLLTSYLTGDEVSYDGVSVVVTFIDANDEILNLPTLDYGDFSEVNVPEIATLEMNEEFTISLNYKGTYAEKTFSSGTFEVIAASISFNLKELTLGGYSNYLDFKDDNELVNMHIAGSSEESVIEKTGGYPVVYDKHSIVFTTLDPTISFKDFNFEFAPYITGSDPKTQSGTIYVKESILGGAPFVKEVGSTTFSSSDTEHKTISNDSLSKGCNAIEISFSNSNHFGVVKFDFTLKSQDNAIQDYISYTGTLTKTTYNYGETFSSSGLTFYVNFSNDFSPVTLSNADEYIVWEPLEVGMTQIEGVFNGMSVIVSGITVNSYVGKTYTRVTENLADFSGVYLITCVTQSVIWNGSLKTTDEMKGSSNYYGVSFDPSYNTLTGDYVADNATFTIKKQASGYYYIVSASGFYCGLTAAGSLQVVSSKPREVNISIDNGNVIISNKDIPETTTVKQIGCSSASKFTTYASGSGSDKLIQLFRCDA